MDFPNLTPRIEIFAKSERSVIANIVLLEIPMAVIRCDRRPNGTWECNVKMPTISSTGADVGKFTNELEAMLENCQ